MADDAPEAEVPTWRGVKTFFPEMTLRVGTSAPVTLEALASALRAAGFRIRHRGTTGFQASYVDWLDVVAGTLNRTRLQVSASTAEGGTGIVVAVRSTGSDLKARKKASAGLSAAVRELRGRGLAVTTTDWAVPESRRKGKRR
ncbi:MAG: hypothetical protein JWO76_1918 [Nocardioides sp.]|nr:hypothetical protein [Nocardioides sp.]